MMTMTELSDASHFSSIPNYNISYKKTRKMIPCIFGVKIELADPNVAPHNWPDQNWLKQKLAQTQNWPMPKLVLQKLARSQNWPIPKLA